MPKTFRISNFAYKSDIAVGSRARAARSRSNNQQSNDNNDNTGYNRSKYSPQSFLRDTDERNSDLAIFLEYIKIRYRQFSIFSMLMSGLTTEISSELKSLLVRNMYWGRTSFYKSSFHILVIVITIGALYSGFDSRIASTQRQSLQNISVSDRIVIDSDVVSQQGSLFPLEQLDLESDSLYFDYTVQSGDSIARIAEANSINENTIRWANNIPLGRDTLRVGQVVKIPKVDGVLYTVRDGDNVDSVLARVELSDQDADRLTFLELNARSINSAGELIVGSTVMLYDATVPQPRPVAPRPRPATPTTVTPGPQNLPSVAPGTFVNPMQLCNYTRGRGYTALHTGVDFPVAPGCWVVSAGEGVVTRAGNCASLGVCVAVKHANGYSTIYGHGNGVIAVSVGQRVAAGQQLLQSGCSGLCFGPHVHLSLTANNQDVFGCYRCRINPAGIIPY